MKKLFFLMMFFALEARTQNVPIIEWQFTNEFTPCGQKIAAAKNDHCILLGSTPFGEIFFTEVDSSGDIFSQKNLGPFGPDTNNDIFDFKKVSDGYAVLAMTYFPNSVNPNTSDAWIRVIKIDETGNILWNKYFGDSNAILSGFAIDEYFDKKLIISGTSYFSSHDQKSFLMLLDSLGNLEWLKKYSFYDTPDYNYNYGEKIISIDSGFCYLDKTYLDNWQNLSYSLLETNKTGDSIFSFLPTQIKLGDDLGFAISNYDQSILFIKKSKDTVSLIKRDMFGYLLSSYDYYFPKFTFYLFEVIPKNDSGYLAVFQENTDTCLFGCPWATFYAINIVRISEEGDTLWTKKIGGDFGHSLVLSSVAPTSDGSYLFSARESDSSYSPYCHLLVFKLRNEENLTNTTFFSLANWHRIYPNPFHDLLNIRIQAEEFHGFSLSLFDLLGQRVFEKEIYNFQNTFSLYFLPGGCYVYKICDKNGLSTFGKVIKN